MAAPFSNFNHSKEVSMFLVLHRCTMDDLPVALFPTKAEAVDFADSLEEMPSEEIQQLFRLDSTTPISVAIVEFSGSRPIHVCFARSFEEESAGHTG
jgi:hypothetical protein